MRALRVDARFWQLVLLFSLAISSTLGIYAMLPLFLVSGLAVLSSFSVGDKKNAAIPFCIPVAFVTGGGIIPLVIGTMGDMLGINAGFVAV